MKKIAIGADHGGWELKEELRQHLQQRGLEVIDCGPFDASSVHYPVYAEKVGQLVQRKEAELGILVCGTGIGMSMAANKMVGIRAAVVSDCFSAEMTRRHNNANILCLGARVVGPGLALRLADTFVDAGFDGERHQQRLDMIAEIEHREIQGEKA